MSLAEENRKDIVAYRIERAYTALEHAKLNFKLNCLEVKYTVGTDPTVYIWWGNDIGYNRSPWSLVNTDKPDEIIKMLTVSGGSELPNDCVPTTLYEIEQVRGGKRTYKNFKNTVILNDDGVNLSAKDYKLLMEDMFGSHNVENMKKTYQTYLTVIS